MKYAIHDELIQSRFRIVMEEYHLDLKVEKTLMRNAIASKRKMYTMGGKVVRVKGQSSVTKREVIEEKKKREETSIGEPAPDYR